MGQGLTSGLEYLGIQKPLSTLGMQTPSSFWPPYFHRMFEIFWTRSITCKLELAHQHMDASRLRRTELCSLPVWKVSPCCQDLPKDLYACVLAGFAALPRPDIDLRVRGSHLHLGVPLHACVRAELPKTLKRCRLPQQALKILTGSHLHLGVPLHGVGAVLVQPAAAEAGLVGLYRQDLHELQLLLSIILQQVQDTSGGCHAQVLKQEHSCTNRGGFRVCIESGWLYHQDCAFGKDRAQALGSICPGRVQTRACLSAMSCLPSMHHNA